MIRNDKDQEGIEKNQEESRRFEKYRFLAHRGGLKKYGFIRTLLGETIYIYSFGDLISFIWKEVDFAYTYVVEIDRIFYYIGFSYEKYKK